MSAHPSPHPASKPKKDSGWTILLIFAAIVLLICTGGGVLVASALDDTTSNTAKATSASESPSASASATPEDDSAPSDCHKGGIDPDADFTTDECTDESASASPDATDSPSPDASSSASPSASASPSTSKSPSPKAQASKQPSTKPAVKKTTKAPVAVAPRPAAPAAKPKPQPKPAAPKPISVGCSSQGSIIYIKISGLSNDGAWKMTVNGPMGAYTYFTPPGKADGNGNYTYPWDIEKSPYQRSAANPDGRDPIGTYFLTITDGKTGRTGIGNFTIYDNG